MASQRHAAPWQEQGATGAQRPHGSRSSSPSSGAGLRGSPRAAPANGGGSLDAAPAAAAAAGPVGSAEAAGDAPPDNHQQQEQQPDKRRPTHFVSLRVSHSPEVVACIEAVQAQLLESCPDLQPCLLEPVTAHLTIMVLHLPGQEQEDAAAAALSGLRCVLEEQGLGRLRLQLAGLSTFRSQVLYLDVAPGPAREQLQRLGDSVASHFRACGGGLVVDEGPGRGFTPHVTVAKTSRLKGHHRHHRRGAAKGRPKIPPEAWAGLAGCEAGPVDVQELQICSMQGRRAGQFYRVAHRLQLPEANGGAGTPAQADAAAVAAPPASPPAQAAAAAAAAGATTRAANGPLAVARRRFKRLLRALACGGGAGGAAAQQRQRAGAAARQEAAGGVAASGPVGSALG